MTGVPQIPLCASAVPATPAERAQNRFSWGHVEHFGVQPKGFLVSGVTVRAAVGRAREHRPGLGDRNLSYGAVIRWVVGLLAARTGRVVAQRVTLGSPFSSLFLPRTLRMEWGRDKERVGKSKEKGRGKRFL